MKRVNKVVLIFTCFFIGVVFLFFITREDEKEGGDSASVIKIGISTYQENDEYIDCIMEETQKVAKEFEKEHNIKINMNLVAAKGDQGIQNKQVEKFISLGYDVICVNAVDRTNVSNIVDQAIAGKVPLIFFNREPVEDDLLRGKNVYYIGSNAKESAKLQGEMIANYYQNHSAEIDKNQNGIIEYAMLEGEVGHQDAIIRTEWVIETLKQKGVKVERVTNGVANWMRDQGAALTEQWLSTYAGRIELIICNNDAMALGALDTMEKFNLPYIPVVGIDGIGEGVKAVDEGRMLGTVRADIEKYGKSLFELSYGLARKENLDHIFSIGEKKNVWIPWRSYRKPVV